MRGEKTLRLSLGEARGLMLHAQGLMSRPAAAPDAADLSAVVDRLGALQIDTINVVERSQYLVLWSRLGRYDPSLLDSLLFPRREVFEYWSHAASIVPMADYPYYRPKMLRYLEHLWKDNVEWSQRNDDVLQRTLETIRERGPLASADFEAPPNARRNGLWDWYGSKDSRRALEILWTTGDLMVHSRRAGQKVYDLRERVLAEALDDGGPPDHGLPGDEERCRHFVRRTVRALGVVTPAWLWDYFRLAVPAGQPGGKRGAALAALQDLQREGFVVPAEIEGVAEKAFVAREFICELDRHHAREAPIATTLLSPFDSLIWDRVRARALFNYEVCFEAYVPPAKRRYGYYCLAVLHRGRIVGRVDPKLDRVARRLIVRTAYLEPEEAMTADLVEGLAGALRDLARFLGAVEVSVIRSEPLALAPALVDRLGAT